MNELRERRLYLGLTAGVFAVSLAAVFIRLAGEAPPLAIAAYRMSLGAAAMSLFAFGRQATGGAPPLRGLARRDLPLIGVSALCLALHFWTWIVSLEHTSVASSVVLVTASPLITAVASRALFGEAIHTRTLVGIGVGLAGGVLLAAGDAGDGSELFGDAMAFLGAIAVVGYMLAGRRLRTRLPATTYNLSVYTVAAVLLWALALGFGAQLEGFRVDTYLWLAVTAIVPQAIGHSLLNWSLGHVTATAVTVAVMAEPVIATIVAIPVLGEQPPLTSVAGGALVLAGIFVAMRKAPGG
ncbi:MAG: DMT family transporter [Chloroflexi bacterium]|nr:DMT family transporter [Chloroflexota bacterium]